MKIDRNKFELAKARACKSTKDLISAGIPKGTLCRVMSGAGARAETIGKIAKILNCDVMDILSDK